MTNEMNIKNLRIFVEALNALPDKVKNNDLNMMSIKNPVCGTPGCHAGLVSLVARYVPELGSLYPESRPYYFKHWADTLARFLGFDNDLHLKLWGKNNLKLWGNKNGYEMFVDGRAFGLKTDVFKHSVIIEHWTKVLLRVEELNNKGEK